MSASTATVAAGPALAPGLSGRDIPTLDTLYEAAGERNFTPGWVPRENPILWGERDRSSARRTGAMRTPRPGSTPQAG